MACACEPSTRRWAACAPSIVLQRASIFVSPLRRLMGLARLSVLELGAAAAALLANLVLAELTLVLLCRLPSATASRADVRHQAA